MRFALILSSLLLSSNGFAFKSPDKTRFVGNKAGMDIVHRVVRPELAPSIRPNALKQRFGSSVSGKIDRKTGAIRVLSGSRFSNTKSLSHTQGRAGFVKQSMDFVNLHRDIFGLSSSDLVLDESAVVFDKKDQFLKFRVHRKGIRVQDASIDFRFKFGKLVQIINQSFAEAKGDAKRRKNRNHLSRVKKIVLNSEVARTETLYRIVPEKAGYRAVLVDVFSAKTENDRFIVQIESNSGKVFEIAPTKFYRDGDASGDVFPRYWVEDLEKRPLGELSVSLSAGSTTTNLDGSFSDSASATAPKVSGLKGTRVDVAVESGSLVNKVATLQGNKWNLDVNKTSSQPAHEDKDVAQTMIFYYTGLMVHHAKKYIESDWFDVPLGANANLNSSCNAHWDGSTINFYSAGSSGSWDCVNTALISDVVFHEWGHGLDHNTGGIEDGAFSEGFGDIMSLVMTKSNILGIGFTVDGQFVRDLAPDKIYPDDRGSVHAEGLIIGSTFYDMYEAFATLYSPEESVNIISNYAFKSIIAASKYTDVYEAILAIDDDDANLANGTPNFCVVNEIFTKHGLAQRSDRCLLGRIETLQIDDGDNGVLEPGESATVNVLITNTTDEDLVNLTGTVSSTSEGVTIDDDHVAWNRIRPGDSASTSDSFSVSVDQSVSCGETLTLTFKLEGNDRTVFSSFDVLAGTLLGTPDSVTASGLPLEIKDNSTITATLDVNGGQWQQDPNNHSAHLEFDITHTYMGDITVWIRPPGGSDIEVFKGSGSGDNVAFSEDITNHVSDAKGKGTWGLVVQDGYYRDEGTLDRFKLTVVPANFACEK